MKIMLCYDPYGKPHVLLSLALKYAKAFTANITVVKVTPMSDNMETPKQIESETTLAQIKDLFAREGLNVLFDIIPSVASIGETIVNYADEHGMDLIITGVFQKSKVGKILFGSTAQYVILNSHCPVLSVN